VKTIRIYQAGDYQPGSAIKLSEEAGQHVGVVLRMQPGEKLTLFPGDNREFDAVITSVNKKKVVVEIVSEAEISRESPLSIDLAQGISKGDRMELVVQKAVELGVHSITPVISSRCVIKLDKQRIEKKRAQWQSIAIAACEQSGRNLIPVIHPVFTFEAYLTNSQHRFKFILEPGAEKKWRNYPLDSGHAVSLLIGPEGGFSTEEILQARQAGFADLSLGPRVLRTETAAITAISVLQAAYGDL